MTYPYGTKGSPAVGRGVPGLPRPAGAAVAHVRAAAVADPAENTTLKFPARADWALGWTTVTATVAGLPSGFGLANGYAYNGDGIGLASGDAFLLPYGRGGFSEQYLGLFVVDGNTITLVDSTAIPANYTANDGGLINFVRTEYDDTFLMCWGAALNTTGQARIYAVKVDQVNRRVTILPDSILLSSSSTSMYEFNIKAAYLRDGVFVVGYSYYHSTTAAISDNRILVVRLTATGLLNGSTYSSLETYGTLISVSPVRDGRFVMLTRAANETAGVHTLHLMRLNADGTITLISSRTQRFAQIDSVQGGGATAGGPIIQCRRGALTYLRAGVAYPVIYANAGSSPMQELVGLTVPLTYPGARLFDADAAGDGAMYVTSETTRRLMLYTPFMDTANESYLRPVQIASLGSGSWMAAHLGRMIVSMSSAGGSAQIYRANAPI